MAAIISFVFPIEVQFSESQNFIEQRGGKGEGPKGSNLSHDSHVTVLDTDSA